MTATTTLCWPTLDGGPQPLGLLPPPEGLLLLPSVDRAGEALAELLAGRLDTELPAAWEPFRLLAHGNREAALAALAGDDPLCRANRFVVTGDEAELEGLEPEGPMAAWLDAARYVQGSLDQPPTASVDLPVELAAMLAWVTAAAWLEKQEPEAALAELEAAIPRVAGCSPLAAAQLSREAARIVATSSPGAAEARWRQALELAGASPLSGFLAETHLERALCLHEQALSGAGDNPSRGTLVAAIDAYQSAIHAGLSVDERPEAYALAQNNLGLAYLSLPMSGAGDALRGAVAVQSFREALKVYGEESHPDAWASAQLNMANALQYLPTSHPEENLAQAVEIYDRLLAVRPKALDPVGHARLLANQANALAHLGMFQPALAGLDEARKLFEWHGQRELAQSVLEQVARIHDQLAVNGAALAAAAEV